MGWGPAPPSLFKIEIQWVYRAVIYHNFSGSCMIKKKFLWEYAICKQWPFFLTEISIATPLIIKELKSQMTKMLFSFDTC